MTEFTFSVIYLGNYADYDPVDGNASPGDTSGLIGTYYGPGNAASDNIVEITAQDSNSDNLINSNDQASPEAVSYDLGSGPVNTFYDSLFNVQTTVTFAPGSGQPDYNGIGGLIQTETGDLFFVMIDDDAGFGANALDNVAIQSIGINSIDAFGSQQSATASDSQEFVPCFTAGTLIKTPFGERPVQDLRIGDQVLTVDNGIQSVTWIGCRRLGPGALAKYPNLAPIAIKAGSLGDGVPEKDLILSPQHHIALSSRIVQRMTGHNEVLVAAKKLIGFPGILQQTSALGVQYYHFTCPNHELVWANGTRAETLFVGEQVKTALHPQITAEMAHISSAAFEDGTPNVLERARPLLSRMSVVQQLCKRHVKNEQPLASGYPGVAFANPQNHSQNEVAF